MLEFNKEHISADLSQVKSKIDNAKKVGKIMLAGVAISSTLLLSGCGNYTILDTKYSFNKAIIFDEDSATIIEIEKWTDYDGEQLQLQTKDGAFILTSSYDTKLMDDRNSDISAEDLVRSLKGDDVQINYLGESVSKEKSR